MSELSIRLHFASAKESAGHFVSKHLQAALRFGSSKTARRDSLQQLPDLIDLMASVLSSGVGYREALEWVTARSSGQMRVQFAQLLAALKVGDSLSDSLLAYESSQSNPALRELALKLALAEQLGTGVTQQLVSLASSVRAEYLVDLRALGSKKETQLLLPLVFMVLPITVLFAFYPSAYLLQFGSI